MRLSSIFTIALVFLVAAASCLFAARYAVQRIEDQSRNAIHVAMEEHDMGWAKVKTDGLYVYLVGTAPTEADRFKALSVAAAEVDPARVVDQMLVADSLQIAPPKFSIEVLRGEQGIQLIGLVPESTDRAGLIERVEAAAANTGVVDLLESADHPAPDTWQGSLDFTITALELLPRSKISASPEKVTITAMTESEAHKQEIESKLAAQAPDGVRLALDISAPRPVITPFTLRYVLTEEKAEFESCSADTEEAQAQILAAAKAAGLTGAADCVIGLGVPSPRWGTAAAMAIRALGTLGAGSVTFSDADISLVAAEGTPQQHFDDVTGTLEADLPDIFALHAVLPETDDKTEEIDPVFIATLSENGQVQLRGRLDSELTRESVESFAKARFTSDGIYNTSRIVDDLPEKWPLRALAGLETLSYLSSGMAVVTEEEVKVTGATGRKDAKSRIAQFLSTKLGEGARFEIDVTYQEVLDPIVSIPSPDECEVAIEKVQLERKIGFEPGSARIDINGSEIIDEIADILKECGQLRMEIGGHTDSQGREEMNANLSKARAMTVLKELSARRVLTSSFTVKGYGESQPIADNDSEDGREANRRIEFRIIYPEQVENGSENAENDAGGGEEQAEPSDQATGDSNTPDENQDASAAESSNDAHEAAQDQDTESE